MSVNRYWSIIHIKFLPVQLFSNWNNISSKNYSCVHVCVYNKTALHFPSTICSLGQCQSFFCNEISTQVEVKSWMCTHNQREGIVVPVFFYFVKHKTSGTQDTPTFTVCTAALLFCHFNILRPEITCQQFWPFLLHSVQSAVECKIAIILSLCLKLSIPFHNLYTIIRILFCACKQVDTKSLSGINFACRLFNFAGTRISESEILQWNIHWIIEGGTPFLVFYYALSNSCKKNWNWLYEMKQLSVMVGGDFFQNETKVTCGQAGFHACGGLAHKGLRFSQITTFQKPD